MPKQHRKQVLTITAIDGVKEALEVLAAEHGCYWGDRPNISYLIEAIALGDLQLVPTEYQARKAKIAKLRVEANKLEAQ